MDGALGFGIKQNLVWTQSSLLSSCVTVASYLISLSPGSFSYNMVMVMMVAVRVMMMVGGGDESDDGSSNNTQVVCSFFHAPVLGNVLV